MARIHAVIALVFVLASAASAVLNSPARVAVPDSAVVRYERGVELTRLSEFGGYERQLSPRVQMAAVARWKTEWQAPEGENDRVRQDGRWYAGLNRSVMPPLQLWGAASGEHFDDRSVGQNEPLSSATSVHILRGGGGVVAKPWKPLSVSLGAGGVQDRRMNKIEGGLGVWTRADVEDWNLAGYVQDFTLQFNRETPTHHENSDRIIRYDNFREFYPGNTNRVEASASRLSRDIYLDATGLLSQRVEKRYAVRDALTYDLRRKVKVEMTGDLLSQSIVQEQSGSDESSLKENQAGFGTEIVAGSDVQQAALSLDLRSVSQTIRGEILRGRKGDLALRGRSPLPFGSAGRLRMSVSKYSLDTPNPLNYDDRDELRYSIEGAWSKPMGKSLIYELHGAVRLDHLVYLFSQRSANNRWTRFFLAGSMMRHRPTEWFTQVMVANVSANYQDYDYETDPREARSTVFRRVTLGDSMSVHVSSRVSVNASVGHQIEEFGRLFWDSFEEERSDETRSSNASLMIAYRFTPRWQVGGGAMWDRRRGERFPDDSREATEVFQDIESYGPMAMADLTESSGFFLTVHARVIRQFQLKRDDRWLTLGEAVGGLRW